MNTTTELQLIATDKLIPYANNARKHNKEQILKLRSSLREFGFVNPVIIDRENNILCGHGRVMAAKEEGITEVPCVYADHLTEAQKKAYILADNRMAMDAGWDEELLAIEMEELQNMGFDLNLTGFDEKEIADLFAVDGDEAKEDDFDVDAELEKPCKSKPGDIWHLGKHTVIPSSILKINKIQKNQTLQSEKSKGRKAVQNNFHEAFLQSFQSQSKIPESYGSIDWKGFLFGEISKVFLSDSDLENTTAKKSD